MNRSATPEKGNPPVRSKGVAEALIEGAPVGLVLLDRSGAILTANPHAEQLLGYGREQLKGLSIHDLLCVNDEPEQHERTDNAKLYQLIQSGSDAGECIAEMRHKDGHDVPILCSAKPIDLNSSSDAMVLSLAPLSGLRKKLRAAESGIDELEARVRERTDALQKTNQDLEGFTYSVSHDLRAPLRAIMGFSKMLVEDHGKEVDKEMRRTLDRINGAALRMSTIIEDLLAFSRLGRKELVRQRVNLSEIAEAVRADLIRRHPERDTTISIEKGIVVEGDPTLLRVAIENLFDNAYKFTSKKPHGKVELKRLGEHTFAVNDNGAGFEPQYIDKLFRPFERLHSASDFPGTGIGLANVRRIIDRHGGRIWAEGEPEKGASFYFEL